MDATEIKMFSCSKYRVNMLAEKADETCARRFEQSLNENSTIHDFDKCRTCNRGAVMYELGKHKSSESGVPPIKAFEGRLHPELKPVAAGFSLREKTSQGETNMGTERIFRKKCETHGEFLATGPRGACPDCKKAKDQDQPGKTKALKVRRSSPGAVEAPALLSGSQMGGGALPISIDLARFPKLHSRLITVGLNAMLAELEMKA